MIQEKTINKTIICVIALTGLLLFSNTKVTAQSDFKVGGSVSYGILTDLSVSTSFGPGGTGSITIDNPQSIGIRGEGIYPFSDKFRSTLDVAFFFGDEDKALDNWLGINANVQYLFSSEGVKPYLLAGVNFVNISTTNGNSDSSIGLNTGGGLEFTTDFGGIFIESNWAISDQGQFNSNGGVRFDI